MRNPPRCSGVGLVRGASRRALAAAGAVPMVGSPVTPPGPPTRHPFLLDVHIPSAPRRGCALSTPDGTCVVFGVFRPGSRTDEIALAAKRASGGRFTRQSNRLPGCCGSLCAPKLCSGTVRETPGLVCRCGALGRWFRSGSSRHRRIDPLLERKPTSGRTGARA